MVVGDLVAVASAAKTGYKEVMDWVDAHRDIEAFDTFQQRFIDVLERALESELTEKIDGQAFVEQYETHREEILQELEGVNFGNQEETINSVCDTMTQVLLEELPNYDIGEETLRRAVEAAYREALEKFVREADSEDQRLLLEMARDIQIDVDELRTTLDDFKQQLKERPGLIGRYERYRLLYPPSDDNWIDELAFDLAVQRERNEFPFLEPEGFDRITDDEVQRVLLAGRKGAGKSRTVLEGVAKLATTVDFSRVVVVTNSMTQTEDLAKAFQNVDGDVLLVFDDLQGSVKDNGLNFEDALTELEQRVEQNNNDLYVRATVRSENLADVLPDGWSLDKLTAQRDEGAKHEQWTTFEGVRLPPLEGDRLERFVEASLAFYNLDPDDEIREAFIKAITDRDPTPFYVTSVCANAEAPLDHDDIEHLPESAVDSWKDAYDNLDDDDVTQWLEALVIVDTLDIPSRERVVRRLYGHLADGRGTDVLDRAEQLGWVTVEKSGRRESRVIIHDVRLEAIDFELKDLGEKLFDFSNFLLDSRRIERLQNDLGAILNANFAEYVFKHRLGSQPVDDARRHFERAIDLNDESPQIYTQYARYLEGQEKVNEGIEILKIGVKEFPEDIRLRGAYGRLLERNGKPEKAIEQFEIAFDHTRGDKTLSETIEETFDTHLRVLKGINLRRDINGKDYIFLFAKEGPFLSRDTVTQERFEYIGEGLRGNQTKENPGNSALIQAQTSDIPIHFFYVLEGAENWEYKGLVDVIDHEFREQNGRNILVFTMEYRQQPQREDPSE